MIPPYCLVSASAIIVTSFLLLCQSITALHVSFLLLGMSSVAHHSRLHQWIVNDSIRALDLCMIAVTTFLSVREYGRHPQLWFLLVYCAFAAFGVRHTTNEFMIRGTQCPRHVFLLLHASAHLAACAVILSLTHRGR